MFSKLRPQNLRINRNILIAGTPIFFLLLLALWTLFIIGIKPVNAQPFSVSVVAEVKRTSANLREGPGTEYRIVGRSLKGATLPVIGQYQNESGQRWYKVYLRAFGEVWVSGTVVEISSPNADIPVVGITQTNGVVKTAEPPSTNGGQQTSDNNNNAGNNGNNGSGSGNNPPSNPAPQPTAVPQQPATTPEPSG